MAAADRHGADGPVLAGLTSVHRDDAESTRGLRHGEISLSLRIGISGHRNIAPDHPGLTGEIAKTCCGPPGHGNRRMSWRAAPSWIAATS